MQRGVLQLSRAEMSALINAVDLNRYVGMHLVNKLQAGAATMAEPVTLEISEDELEVLMDEIGVPIPEESLEMPSIRVKLNQLMNNFRSAF